MRTNLIPSWLKTMVAEDVGCSEGAALQEKS